MLDRPQMITVSGMPLPEPFAANWENVQRFQARDDDVLIITFPRSGTTWMSEVVDLIFHEGDTEKAHQRPIYERVPFLEWAGPDMPTGTEILDNIKGRRIMKSHCPADLLPQSFSEKNCKVIYVARNPKDVMVSFYHFHRMHPISSTPGTLQEFMMGFIEGTITFGSWSRNVKGWWKNRHQKNVLFLFYEDLLEDTKPEIKKVMTFLEKDLPDDVLEKIHQHTTFRAMKENKMTNYTDLPLDVMDHTISPFIRKGICGDWKNHLTVAQNEIFDEFLQRELSDTDLTFRYQD
ncbi:sulfotransferase 1B1-like [Hyperolius riggenbachi]|uniref:sulfotransferase 1B1-like n=1 Tax=Hyperolius riggenbachi TaxID=752182 RepID=UPI0035A2E593